MPPMVTPPLLITKLTQPEWLAGTRKRNEAKTAEAGYTADKPLTINLL